MFAVQKNVPIPRVNRAPQVASRKYRLDEMAVGDMFFVPGRTSKSVSAYMARISKGMTQKFSVRHCWMTQVEGHVDKIEWVMSAEGEPGAKEGTGVWRVE